MKTSCATWCRDNGVLVGDHVLFRPKPKLAWRRALVTELSPQAVLITRVDDGSKFILTGCATDRFNRPCLQLKLEAVA